MLIIGSTALKHYYPDFKRKPKDIDIIGNKNVLILNDLTNELGVYKVEHLENPIILKYQDNGYIRPELLLSLKISHLFWNTNWEKHIFDVQFLLNKGVKYDLDLINELIEFWKVHLPKIRRSNLVLSKEEFFTNGVNENTDQHDHIHTILNPTPTYTLLLKEGSEVELDENKWVKLSFEQKCDVVFEETAVMAWERYKKMNYRDAFLLQLKDNIIKHFPFYIALFAIENYPKLQKPKINYRELINQNYGN